jgi:hypothetical protein
MSRSTFRIGLVLLVLVTVLLNAADRPRVRADESAGAAAPASILEAEPIAESTEPAEPASTATATATATATGVSTEAAVLPAGTTAEHTFVAMLGSGPATVPGACWSYTENDGGAPGSTIAGPVCDDDNDGIVVLSDLPAGSSCFVVEPPAGYYRPEGDYVSCASDLGGGETTLGFLQLPTATPTQTLTPSITPTPTRTSTPTAVSSPVAGEPTTTITVQNCLNALPDPTFPDFIYLNACSPVSGVKLSVIQHGASIGEFTSGPDGTITVTLGDRSPYRLHYISGNSAAWTPGPLEESRPRYDAVREFKFQPAASVNADWTIVVRPQDGSIAGFPPLGGTCWEIVDRNEKLLLPEQCDLDNDGEVVFPDKLPPTYFDYRARQTRTPTGYEMLQASIAVSWPATTDYQAITTGFLIDKLHPYITVKTVDAVTGEPVPGFCYYPRFQTSGTPALNTQCDSVSGGADGTVVLETRVLNTTYEIVSNGTTPGLVASPSVQTLVVTDETHYTVTFQAVPAGTDDPSFADLDVQLRDERGDPRFAAFLICYDLDRQGGGYSASNVCGSFDTATVHFEDLPAGTYTLTNVKEVFNNDCIEPALDPIVVTDQDLGTTVESTIVFDCFPVDEPLVTCSTTLTITRILDIYYGDLTDQETRQILASGLELSESLSSGLRFRIANAPDNPDPDRIDSVALFPYDLESSNFDWIVSPDWQADARAALLEELASGGGNLQVDTETITLLEPIVLEDFESFVTDPQLYPGCEDADPNTRALLHVSLRANVRIVKLEAVLAPEVIESSPTPTATATATPDPVPCNVPVVRELDIAFGSLSDVESGDALLSALQLSETVPAELAEQLAEHGVSAIVRGRVDGWTDGGTTPGEWALAEPSDRDALAGLIARFAAADPNLTLGNQIDRGTIEIEIGTLVTVLDEAELPAGCVVASWGLLYAVEQPVVARVHSIELNATGSGELPSNATATVTPTRTPNAPDSDADNVTRLPSTGAGSTSTGKNWLWLLLLTLFALTTTKHVKRSRA